VLEIGVGCSTLVLAEAVARNKVGHVFTVDASRHWIAVTQRDTPARLRDFITFVHSPLESLTYGGELCSRYTNLPDVMPDFLYLDAPSNSDIPDWPKGRPEHAVDPVLIESKLQPGFCMIVDARQANVAFLKRCLRRTYDVWHHDIFKITRFDLRN
jgi:hypothetical protein